MPDQKWRLAVPTKHGGWQCRAVPGSAKKKKNPKKKISKNDFVSKKNDGFQKKTAVFVVFEGI